MLEYWSIGELVLWALKYLFHFRRVFEWAEDLALLAFF
jgi:hypothetical protein